MPNLVRFGREICGDLGQAERREWWLANGLGGYAAGTIAGSLTRRYHGLLIAPLDPPLGRRLVWAKADAELVDGEQSWPLFTNRWSGGAVSPQGHVHIESFHLDGAIPVWCFAIGSIRVEARVWLEPGANTAYVAWRLMPSPSGLPHALSLRVPLMVNDRDPITVRPRQGKSIRNCRPMRRGCGYASETSPLPFRAHHGVITPARQWIVGSAMS